MNSKENIIPDNLLTSSQFMNDVANDLLKVLVSGNNLEDSGPRDKYLGSDDRSVFVGSHLFWKAQNKTKDEPFIKEAEVAGCKEGKRWTRPILAAAGYVLEDNLGKPFNKRVDSHSFQSNSEQGCGGGRLGNMNVSDTNLFSRRPEESDCHNMSACDNVPSAPSPSSVSSVTSCRRLEWDSGADVGYAPQGFMAENKVDLSTIERIALARGCSAVLCSRVDSERTPSGKPVTFIQNPSVSATKPFAHSTPIEHDDAQTQKMSSALETDSESEITPILRHPVMPNDLCEQINQDMIESSQNYKGLFRPDNLPGSETVSKFKYSASLGAKHSNSLTDLQKCEGNKSAEIRSNSLPRNHDKAVHLSKDKKLVDSVKNNQYSASSSSVATVVYQHKLFSNKPVDVASSKPPAGSTDSGVNCKFKCNSSNLHERLQKCSLETQQNIGEKANGEHLNALKKISLQSGQKSDKVCAVERSSDSDVCNIENCSRSYPCDGERVQDNVENAVKMSSMAEHSATEEPCGTMGSVASSTRTTGTPQGVWQESAAVVGSANSFEYLPGHEYNPRGSMHASWAASPAHLMDGKSEDSGMSDGDVERGVKLLEDAMVGVHDAGKRELLVDCVARRLLGLPELRTPREVSEMVLDGAAGDQVPQVQDVDSSEVSSTVFKPLHASPGKTLSADQNKRRVLLRCAAKGSVHSDSTVETSSVSGKGHGDLQEDCKIAVTFSKQGFEQRRAHLKSADTKVSSRNNIALSEFCDSERASQLSWIQLEIEHLKNLKHLLMDQEAVHCPGKAVKEAERDQKSSAPVCTLMKITKNTLQSSRSETSTTECERSISIMHDGTSIHELECRAGVRQIVSRKPTAHMPRAPLRGGGRQEENVGSTCDPHAHNSHVGNMGLECNTSMQAGRDCLEGAMVLETSAFNQEVHSDGNLPVQSTVMLHNGQYEAFSHNSPHDRGSMCGYLKSESEYARTREVGMQVPSTENLFFDGRDKLHDVCTEVSNTQSISGRNDNRYSGTSSVRDVGRVCNIGTQVSGTQNIMRGNGCITSKRDVKKLQNVCAKVPSTPNVTRSGDTYFKISSLRDDGRLRNVHTQVPSTQNTKGRSDDKYLRYEERLCDASIQVSSTPNITGSVDGHGSITSRRDYGRLRDMCNQNVTGKVDDKYSKIGSLRDERLHDVCIQVPSTQNIIRIMDDGISLNKCTQVPSAQHIKEIKRKSFSEISSEILLKTSRKAVSTQTNTLNDIASSTNSGTLEGISERMLDSNEMGNANFPSGDQGTRARENVFSQDRSSQKKLNSPMCCCECRRELRKLLLENNLCCKRDDSKQSRVSSRRSFMPQCRVCGMRLDECAEKRTEAFLRKTSGGAVTQAPSSGTLPHVHSGWVGQEDRGAKLGKRCPCCFLVEDYFTDESSSVGERTDIRTSLGRSNSRLKPGRTAGSSRMTIDEVRMVDEVQKGEKLDAKLQIGSHAPVSHLPDDGLPSPVGYVLTLESSPSMDSGVHLEERRKRKSLPEVKVKVPSRKRGVQEKVKSGLGSRVKHSRSISGTKENAYGRKPTLQEWLARNRPDFVATAEERRQCLHELAELREARAKSRHHALSSAASSDKGSCSADVPPPPLAVKRVFDQRTMRRQTEKKYQRLPEVQNKKTERKRKEDYRTNRLMADIFTRKLQTKVLKGEVNLSNSVSVISNF